MEWSHDTTAKSIPITCRTNRVKNVQGCLIVIYHLPVGPVAAIHYPRKCAGRHMGRVADPAAFPPAHVGQHDLVRVECTNHWTHHDLLPPPPGVLPVHPDSKGTSGFSRLVLKSTPATLHGPSPR